MTEAVNTSEFKARVKEACEAGVIEGDGHTLFAPEHYAPHFTAQELYEAGLVEVHESDGTPKGTIFSPEGNIVKSVEAVYNLEFLYWVARKVGADTRKVTAMGRGSQAEQLVWVISEAVS